MEMGECPGILETPAPYQDLYQYAQNNRIYICKKYQDFIQNPILHTLYKLSLILSETSANKMKTKIIWKCLRLTNKYEEFDLEEIDPETLEELEWYSTTHDEEIINQLRLEKVFELASSFIEEEFKKILTDIHNYREDLEYQKRILTIVNTLRKTALNDNTLDVVGQFL